MIDKVIPRQNTFNQDKEISDKLPTPILLFIFKESVCNKLTSANDIFKIYSKIKLTCKFLNGYVSDDISHFLNIIDTKNFMMVKIFNFIVEKSFYRSSFFFGKLEEVSNELAWRLKQLLTTNKISELINLTDKLLPHDSRYYRIACEKLYSKVIDQPYRWQSRDDHMITLLSLECAKKDTRATAQLFRRIPLIFLKSAEEVGKECAKNDPCATLEFIDNFSKALVVYNFGHINTIHFENVTLEANSQLSKINFPFESSSSLIDTSCG